MPLSADATFRPRLRAGLQALPVNDQQTHFAISDRRRLVPHVLTMPAGFVGLAQLFDGSRTMADLRRLLQEQGLDVPLSVIDKLTDALDEALFLDSQTFADYLSGPTRLPSCVGCYPDDPTAIARELNPLFTAAGGPGRPESTSASSSSRKRPKAILAPHMDYQRGGVTYGWAYHPVAGLSDVNLFIIIATSHYSPHRFTLTRKNYQTPLGMVETDQRLVDVIASEYGPAVFDDPYAHLPEHSIELEVLMLQHVRGTNQPFRIVPLLVGSFADCVLEGTPPETMPDIQQMVKVLRTVERIAQEPVCYIISGDLAHIGPKFDDPDPVHSTQLAHSLTQDQKLLACLESANPAGYFEVIAQEHDCRRICGLPPTWLTMSVLRPTAGQILHYNRYVHPQGYESVSFAAAAFYE